MPSNNDHLDQGFGIEIECYLPEGSTQTGVAQAITHRIGTMCVVESYNHQARGHWKVVTDGSLGDYARGIELVSPKLRGEAGLAQADQVMRALADFGCTVSRQCGLHVHVGVDTPPLDFFKRLVKLYSMYEPVIDTLMPISRRASANLYCRSMTSASPTNVDRARSLDDLIHAVSGSHGGERRYYKLNLTAYARHQTVEFRQHSGTLDANKARNWTLLCLRMVAAAKHADLNLGTTVRPLNNARPGTKSYIIGELMLRPEGVSGPEALAATGWLKVSLKHQAEVCGIETTTQRIGREIRYFARSAQAATPSTPITIDGLADLIGASPDHRTYMQQRAHDLRGPVQWAS